jgi:hypothetical protein
MLLYRCKVWGAGGASWPLKMGPIGCLRTSAKNYHWTLSDVPEDSRSHLHRGGSLKSRTFGLRLELLDTEMEVAGTSETSVSLYQAARRGTLQDFSLFQWCCCQYFAVLRRAFARVRKRKKWVGWSVKQKSSGQQVSKALEDRRPGHFLIANQMSPTAWLATCGAGSNPQGEREVLKDVVFKLLSQIFSRLRTRILGEITALLRYYASSCGNYLPTFRNNVSFPYSTVKGSKKTITTRRCVMPQKSADLTYIATEAWKAVKILGL